MYSVHRAPTNSKILIRNDTQLNSILQRIEISTLFLHSNSLTTHYNKDVQQLRYLSDRSYTVDLLLIYFPITLFCCLFLSNGTRVNSIINFDMPYPIHYLLTVNRFITIQLISLSWDCITKADIQIYTKRFYVIHWKEIKSSNSYSYVHL